ncbi:MAG: NAD-dependent epimerase/dehydratase family protein, partial [Phycisphaeraceae bacterium]|nr:NAD-dependent epimerase/dehydratase family protein [Phycisphaeraceae bacterium]
LADGWDVRCFQRHPSGMADEQATGGARVEDFLGSIVEPADVRRALEGVDAVVHLAARVGIDGSWSHFETVNVQGTRLVLDCAADAGVHAFVYVSSPSVAHVGEPLIAAQADTADPARTRGHYSRSKAMAERIALDPRVSVPVVAVRPHLVWGPGDQQLIGRIINRAVSGRLFLIDGGRALIDTTYVDNAGEAIVRALDRAQEPSVRGRAFVVSNGEPRPVRDVIEAIV